MPLNENDNDNISKIDNINNFMEMCCMKKKKK
jgi:hypothetical protein